MKIKGWLRPFTLLLLFCLVFSTVAMSQTANKQNNAGNMYTIWMKLALLGKNQAEIEYYFRQFDEASLEKIKSKVRFAVLENLRRSGIKTLIAKSSDIDDLNVVVQRIMTEIRYVGMELDDDLKLSIKEEFGVYLENL